MSLNRCGGSGLKRALVVGALLGAVLGPTQASADTASEVAFFDELARKDYAKGRYREALESFLLADELAPSARSLYNVGLCADLAGEDALAFAYFGTYLAGPDADGARRADAEARALRLQQRLAVVRIETDPPGASIAVDRAELGDYGRTPRAVPVAPGERTLLVTLPGFQPARVAVTARVGAVQPVTLRLQPVLGVVKVAVEPPGARLALVSAPAAAVSAAPGAAASTGAAPPASAPAAAAPAGTAPDQPLAPVEGALSLPVGRHRLRATAPGHEPAEVEVLVRADAPASVALSLTRIPAPVGALLVSTGRVPARLYLGGKAWGMTPARVERLPVGTHRVELRAPGRRPWRGTVRVERDRTAFVSVTLRPSAR